MKTTIFTLAILTFASVTTSMYAQTGTPIAPKSNQPQPSPTTGETPTISGVLASKLLLGNHCMIKSAKMASEKAKSEQVRDFAEMLATEHAECNESLKSLAPKSFLNELKGWEQKLTSDSRTDANRVAQNQQQAQDAEARRIQQTQTSDRTQQVGGEARVLHQLCEIEKSASLKKSEAVEKMLKDCSKEDFDMCFVGGQIVAHTEMLACLEAIKEANVPELSQVCDKAVSMTKTHLEKANSLAKTLGTEYKENSDKD